MIDWSYVLAVMVTSAFGLQAIVFGLAAIGINIQFGYTGLLNFGQAAFMAVGGYSIAVVVATFGLNFWIGVPIGIIAAILLALLLGIPTLRLRADYLAIVTIAAAEIIRLILRSVTFKEIFGGSDGRNGFADQFFEMSPLPADASVQIGPAVINDEQLFTYAVGWTLVALALLLTWLLVRSPWGRVVKGIREDEDAVRSLGKNVFTYKMQALIIGGVFGAIAGFITAVGSQNVNPDTFKTDATFFAYAILILGGAARVFGPLLGTIIFWALFQGTDVFLREGIDAGLPIISLMDGTQAAVLRVMLVGLGIMLLMIFRPQGILGDRKELALDAR